MTDQDKKVCDLCGNASDRFKICENCGYTLCFNCITTSSGAILRVDRSPECSRCGSNRITLYDKSRKSP